MVCGFFSPRRRNRGTKRGEMLGAEEGHGEERARCETTGQTREEAQG